LCHRAARQVTAKADYNTASFGGIIRAFLESKILP
jgi:hypothetical protein